ncbi:LOW QUALITY PROTEIN: hypothetical protein V2J09_004034 [Rumex salicifolius]
MALEEDKNIKDLQWILQQLESGTISNLQNISFHLNHQFSACYQETETSFKITLSKDSHALFPYLLAEMSTTTATKITISSSLRTLEFHRVEWQLDHINGLAELLSNTTSIKQILFYKNGFSFECLKVFSEILTRNRVIKEIMFSESSIGATGAGFLASALTVNYSLEDLQIWEDSIGLQGAEELSKAIEVNPSLKMLTIFDSSPNTATPLLSAVLARNRATEVHVWSSGSKESTSKVVEFVPENGTLRLFKIALSGACRIATALGYNTTVKSLDLTGVMLSSRWAKELRWTLEQNQTLKELKLTNCGLKNKAVVYIAAALFKNRHLESLALDGNWFSGVGVEHLLCPLSRFSALQFQANVSLTSVAFGGRKTKIGRDGLAAVLQMLLTNQSLTHLGIYDDESLKAEDFFRMFRTLEKNTHLKHLSLQGCKGVDGELVFKAITGTLQVNPWIQDIDLARTPLHSSGKAEQIYQKLGQNERSELDIDLLKNMPMTMPKSCRVFLCGQEYAGKTTLCNSILHNSSPTKVPYFDHFRSLVNPVEQVVKADGMKIKTFKDEDIKISLWNLAGQHEFYSLHDLMFPGHGSASFFLIILSLFRKPNNKEPKNPTEIEEDLQYWLRFIVSNSRRAVQQCLLPSVTIVLTHYDKINQSSSQNLQASVNSVLRIRDKFHGFVEFYPSVFTVDARSSTSVSKLSQHIKQMSKTILQRVPRVYQLCNDLIQIISDWRLENNNKPAMSWKEFGELCQVKVLPLRIRSRHDIVEKTEMRRRAIASCLHHIGEVIYFDDPGFLILDCEWFCEEVLGQLVRLSAKEKSSEKDGFVSKKELEKILKSSLQSQIPGMSSKIFGNLQPGDLVKMMLKLELCYEQDPSDPNSPLLIPSLLKEGRQNPQKWQFATTECIYIGRHLECDDSSHMCNSIIRSQHWRTSMVELTALKNTSSPSTSMVCTVELGGQLGYYIDVLACSTKNITETLRLFQQLIIPSIHKLCHGVMLIESVIRPECVQLLTPPRYRKTQSVQLQNLKQALLSVPADSMYDYQHTWSSVADSGKPVLQSAFDFARDLLSEDDFREVLHRRYHDLYNLATELQVPTENNPDEPDDHQSSVVNDISIDPSFNGIAKGVEQVLQRLKIIEQEIRDVKQEIQGLRYYEHRLLIELHRKVDHLVNYSTQLEERKAPNMFFFVRTDDYTRRLITSIIPGMAALRLHMLCEFRREMHVVEDQMGCEVMQVDNTAVKSLAPYMTKFMKLLTFALKIGAHMAAGLGQMIPDLSREVGHLMDSSLLTGAVAAGAVGAMAIGGRARQNQRDIQQEQAAAQQWLLDFLRERGCSTGKDIAENFGLWRVRYRDSGQIAWICRRHLSLRAHEVIEVPL